MTPTPLALMRYQAISAYLALDPTRGKRRAVLEQLASKPWPHPDGTTTRYAAETLRQWVRRYRRGGLAALDDAPRPQRGVQVLTAEQIELFCKLKQEVPERSLDRLITIAEELGLVDASTVRRSTLHRALQARGLSQRPRSDASTKDLDRFEAEAPNDLWQSDMLAGPWLPDPARPGKVRRAWLYAFLDDHSRLLLAGRFSFKEDLPTLELVFRDALRRHGVPSRVYYDNGATYRSRHMQQVVAELGIHRLIFTTVRRPEGHGKIEAFNRLCTSAFIAEVKASSIRTLDALNAAFDAWLVRYYNKNVHGETGQAPHERWRAGLDRVRHVDEEVLRRAFLWRETRTADKAGVLSLFGCKYQVGPDLAKQQVALLYDPERLDVVEVWHKDRFIERIRPFEVQSHRRPKPKAEPATNDAPQDDVEPVADWLSHLTKAHQGALRQDPEAALRHALAEREALDDGVVQRLRTELADEVMDEPTVREWLARFGPFTPERVEDVLALALPTVGRSQHIQHYLDVIHDALLGGDA